LSSMSLFVYFFQTQRCVKPCRCCDCTTSVSREDQHMYAFSINLYNSLRLLDSQSWVNIYTQSICHPHLCRNLEGKL
jgi:hypothetical protein